MSVLAQASDSHACWLPLQVALSIPSWAGTLLNQTERNWFNPLCHQREGWGLECSCFHSTGVWWQNHILEPFFHLRHTKHRREGYNHQLDQVSRCGQRSAGTCAARPHLSFLIGLLWPWKLWQLWRQESYLIFPEWIIESNMCVYFASCPTIGKRSTDMNNRSSNPWNRSVFFVMLLRSNR